MLIYGWMLDPRLESHANLVLLPSYVFRFHCVTKPQNLLVILSSLFLYVISRAVRIRLFSLSVCPSVAIFVDLRFLAMY